MLESDGSADRKRFSHVVQATNTQGVALGHQVYSSFAVVDVPGQVGLSVRLGSSHAGVINGQGACWRPTPLACCLPP